MRFQAIHKYIVENLFRTHDQKVFEFKSLSEVGKYFSDKTLVAIDGSSIDEIKVVVSAMANNEIKELRNDDEFYEVFAKTLTYNAIPQKVYYTCLKEYLKLYKHYSAVISVIDNKVSTINNELNFEKIRQQQLTNECNNRKNFLKDLKSYEDRLVISYTKCHELRTKKEMLIFSKNNLEDFLGILSDKTNRLQIITEIKKIATKYLNKEAFETKDVFGSYYDIIDITESNIETPLKIFFNIKLYRFISEIRQHFYKSGNIDGKYEDLLVECKKMFESLPEISTLCCLKETDNLAYKEKLRFLIDEHNVVDYIKNIIHSNYSLSNRKSLIDKNLSFFENGDYEIFNNLIPVQLEGIFGDYLKDASTFNRFSDLKLYEKDVLRDKISHLKMIDSGIYFESILHFYYYFNNHVRNPIAHGNLSNAFSDHDSAEILSLELILDLNFLLYMLNRESESQRFLRYVQNYKLVYQRLNCDSDSHFGGLLNDLNGSRIHSDYDRIGFPRPLQIVYWLVNPYYEDIYKNMADINELLELRSDLLSKNFWIYVNNEFDKIVQQGYSYNKIHGEFPKIIKGLFNCIQDPDVKALLQHVNSKISKFIGIGI